MTALKLIQVNHVGLSNKYRLLFILLAWIITSFILNHYSSLLNSFIPQSNFYREFLICGGQIVVQFFIVGRLSKDKVIYYLTNLMVISLGGALLLLPMIIISNFISVAPVIAAGYFMLIVLVMLLEHIRRVKILEISFIATVSWVVYRLVVLIIISWYEENCFSRR